MDKALVRLSYFSFAPFLLSLGLYWLYDLFPQREFQFYLSAVGFGTAGLLAGGWLVCRPINFKFVLPRPLTEWLVIGGLVIWTLVRTVAFPPTWGDVFEYLQQGYVFAQDRSLDRVSIPVPYSEDGSYYVMNSAIQPGIPILYSIYFLGHEPSPLRVSLTHIWYAYYFVLLLISLYYAGKVIGLPQSKRYLPLLVALGCFYLLRFTILGAKEVILMQLTIVAILSLEELARNRININWKMVIILGMSLGIISFVNLNGTIIASILGLLLLAWLPYRLGKRLAVAGVTIALTLLFSAGEPIRSLQGFIINPSLLQSSPNSELADKLKNAELANYQLIQEPPAINTVPAVSVSQTKLIDPTAWNVFWKGKLQGLTQIQFFGFVYWLLIASLIMDWKNRGHWTKLEKILLSYIVLYFLIIMDPFGLNPHHYAYVLSISPKYTLLLLPMAAIIISGRYRKLDQLISRLPYRYLPIALVALLWFVTPIRVATTNYLYEMISQTLPLTAAKAYYLSMINRLLLALGASSIVLTLVIKNKSQFIRATWVILLSLPTLILMENNFSLTKSFGYLASPWYDKLRLGEVVQDNQETFALMHVINTELSQDSQILMLKKDNRLPFYVANKKRLRVVSDPHSETQFTDQITKGFITFDYLIYTEEEETSKYLKMFGLGQIREIGSYKLAEINHE